MKSRKAVFMAGLIVFGMIGAAFAATRGGRGHQSRFRDARASRPDDTACGDKEV